MKKSLFILAASCICIFSLQAQRNYRTGVEFQPMSFDQMAAPLIMAQNAAQNISSQYESILNMATSAIRDGNVYSAHYYTDKCLKMAENYKFLQGEFHYLYFLKGLCYLMSEDVDNAEKYLNWAYHDGTGFAPAYDVLKRIKEAKENY